MNLLLGIKKVLIKNKIKFNQPLILAVSGGLDSVCLLDVFSKLFDKKYLTIAHFDHGLRKDSKNDANFVKKLCEKYQVGFVLGKAVDLKNQKGNLEENAREARYNFLFREAKRKKAKTIVVAHHGDDQIETVLMNFLRGADIEGLSGMVVKSNREVGNGSFTILRPLLYFFKKDLIKYSGENFLSWREDKTNLNFSLKRNYLRHKILSHLSEHEKDEILKDISLLQKQKNKISKSLKQLFQKNIMYKSENMIVFKTDILKLNKNILAEIIFLAVLHINKRAKDFKKDNYFKIISNIRDGKKGKTYLLPNKLKVISDYDSVIILKGALPKLSFNRKKLNMGKNKISKLGIEISLSRKKSENSMDLEKINFPVFIRSFSPGDKFYPKGILGSKKIKDYFIDKKIPKSLRCSIPLIVDSRGLILSISGLQISQKVIIRKSTKKYLTISYKKI